MDRGISSPLGFHVCLLLLLIYRAIRFVFSIGGGEGCSRAENRHSEQRKLDRATGKPCDIPHKLSPLHPGDSGTVSRRWRGDNPTLVMGKMNISLTFANE